MRWIQPRSLRPKGRWCFFPCGLNEKEEIHIRQTSISPKLPSWCLQNPSKQRLPVKRNIFELLRKFDPWNFWTLADRPNGLGTHAKTCTEKLAKLPADSYSKHTLSSKPLHTKKKNVKTKPFGLCVTNIRFQSPQQVEIKMAASPSKCAVVAKCFTESVQVRTKNRWVKQVLSSNQIGLLLSESKPHTSHTFIKSQQINFHMHQPNLETGWGVQPLKRHGNPATTQKAKAN